MSPNEVPMPDEMDRAPIVITTMINVAVLADPAQDVANWHSPACMRARQSLVTYGLITNHDGNWKATEKGHLWLRYLCATPLPERVERWELPARG